VSATLPIDSSEPVQHPSWCDPTQCTVRRPGEPVWHRTPARKVGDATVLGEVSDAPPAAPRRLIVIEFRGCACGCDECQPTDVIMLSYDDARGVYGALGTVLAELHPQDGDQ
jgi:hypothetical protein